MYEPMPQPDLAAFYSRAAPKLEALVAKNITAPPEVIEEACQTAWSRLSGRGAGVAQQSSFAWLATTAMRETLRLLKQQSREDSLDAPGHGGKMLEFPARAPGPERMLELREQLAEVRQLPIRQRQMVWLQGLGYGYDEIAARTGDTTRTVERQLDRARRRLADTAIERRPTG